MLSNSVIQHKSRPPLRWLANIAGSMGSAAVWQLSCLDEDGRYGLKYKFYSLIYRYSMPIYFKYGSFYNWDFDMSGKGWDDYDENGVAYWDKWVDWDYEDEETGDAFRVIYDPTNLLRQTTEK